MCFSLMSGQDKIYTNAQTYNSSLVSFFKDTFEFKPDIKAGFARDFGIFQPHSVKYFALGRFYVYDDTLYYANVRYTRGIPINAWFMFSIFP